MVLYANALAGFLLATVVVSARPSSDLEFHFSSSVTPDSYWITPLPRTPVKCIGDDIKALPPEHSRRVLRSNNADYEYSCFGVGEALCYNNEPGGFGRWIFGIDKNSRQVNLWSPSLEVVWSHCTEASHVCVAVETGYNPQAPTYSKERPEMFFYDENTQTYVGELTCDGTEGKASSIIILFLMHAFIFNTQNVYTAN